MDLTDFLGELAKQDIVLIGEDHSLNGGREVMRRNAQIILTHLSRLAEPKKIILGLEHLSPYEARSGNAAEILRARGYNQLVSMIELIDPNFFGMESTNHQFANAIAEHKTPDSLCLALLGSNHLKGALGVIQYLSVMPSLSGCGIAVVEQTPSANSSILRKSCSERILSYLILGELTQKA